MKRYLFLLHRWLGILLCIFMALWFVSGVVMMYVGYPKLTQQERLAGLPALSSADCCISVSAARKALTLDSPIQGVRLTSVGGQPVYVFSLAGNRFAAVEGRRGERIAAVNALVAQQSAVAFMPGKPVYLGLQNQDAWTHSRALDGHRPLHVIEMQGEDATLLYVSSVTGEVVRDARLTERRWNWVGAWLHWLYPLRGGWLTAWWTDVVIYLSLAATVLGIAGLGVGILRWRRRPYANGCRSPYRSAWGRWHHRFGLVFGALVVTWILSGLFSMNPWKIFDAGAARPPRQVPHLADTKMTTQAMLDCLDAAGFSASELQWTQLGDAGFVLAKRATGDSKLLPEGRCEPIDSHNLDALAKAGQGLMPAAKAGEVVLQTAYDWHYYARAEHTMGGHLERPLPVLKMVFDDPAATWLYLDPRSGAVIQRLDSHTRVKRVAFALLHSWDWLPLLTHRPLWDGLMILGSLGGLIVSVSGIVLGWRRLRRP